MSVTPKLDPARRNALHDAMSDYVQRGEVPGMVTLIARGDREVHVDAIGVRSLGHPAPMRRDTIFRIASITKPITAAAAMVLVDDGIIRLDDAVERWLPELANRRVLRSLDAQLDDTVPADRAITLRDLLTSCFGFGSVLAPPDSYPIQRTIRARRLGGDGPAYLLDPPPTDSWIRSLGELPLMYQPGARWTYNTASDLLGVLIARVSGKSLERFLHERITGPLGMKDTAFHVSPSKLDRLPTCYGFDVASQQLRVFDSAEHSAWRRAPPFESGAGGLTSTVDDYFAFCRMLLNKGRSGSTRVLSESAVAAMTRDQLTPWQRQGADLFFGKHASWGFGMSVDIHREKPWNVPGRFGWDGGFGTSAYSDPTNDFVAILLTQRLMDSPEAPALYDDFWRHAYRAALHA